jgi:Sulfotransferase family
MFYELFGYRRRRECLDHRGNLSVIEAAPILIGGCEYSGTTLLRHMLDRHPSIMPGSKGTVFLERITPVMENADLFGFHPDEIKRSDNPVWADKTPRNALRLSFVQKHLPNAYFIHVIRDGRDVACSLLSQSWMKPMTALPQRQLSSARRIGCYRLSRDV